MIKSSIQKVCRWLRSPSKMAIGGVILLTIIGTIVGTNLFNTGMATTNTEQFCSDCHTNDVVPEYQASIHFSNRSGVKAICSDCHVPHEFVPKMVRKMQASTEVYAHFTGKVDTKEKFEKHRKRRKAPNHESACRRKGRSQRQKMEPGAMHGPARIPIVQSRSTLRSAVSRGV